MVHVLKIHLLQIQSSPCFTNPCFTNPVLQIQSSPCFTNPVHVLQINSSPCFTICHLRTEYDCFEFLFDQPVNIDTLTKYRVEALISGPSSEKVKGCYRNTNWFTFSASDNENNGTDAREGQFLEFVFLRCDKR